ncbi:NAD(P)/FAD-dependent oxidoreductase [Rhodoligotrophos ferricapiens]|uniref:NAD(P)/FAD-dependent oxidoreductase n=1 Tax=Rhodoligotrophos ferricapiens TaxID=3069264 RepID=UPI00315C9798
MKCVVVGGGVIGTSVAWHLAAEPGCEVTLLERDQLSSGTTWHSAGNITWKPLPDHDAPILYALETIRRLEDELSLHTGWLRTGRLFLGKASATLETFDRFNREARSRDIPSRWLKAEEARALNPLLTSEIFKDIWLDPLSGRLNPSDLTQAYATAARRAGARIVETAEVTGLRTGGGRVTAVRVKDTWLDADLVVIAGGLWSRGLLEPLGIQLAQWPCQHFYLIADVTPRLGRQTPSFVAPDDLLYGREETGSLLFGCFDESALTIDPADLPVPFTFTLLPPNWDKIEPYFLRAVEIFPALETAPIRQFVNGPESFTPDGLPLIGRLDNIEGLVVATGMNSVGVTWSAMTGKLVSCIATGRDSGLEASRYDPNRFGGRGSDLAWLKEEVSEIVSRGYIHQSLGDRGAVRLG